MTNTFTTAIRFGAVLGMGLFAFIHQVFAAPIVTPVMVDTYGVSGAMAYAKAGVGNGSGAVSVWIEWGTTPNPSTIIGMRSVNSFEGSMAPFEAGVTNLEAGQTYYFRSVALEDGVTVVSPVTQFTMPGKSAKSASPAAVGQSVAPVVTPTTAPVTQTVAPVTQTTTEPKVVTKVVERVVEKPVVKVVPAVSAATNPETAGTDANTAIDPNSAAVIGADGIFPQTFIGWIGLIIALLVMVLIMKMLSESFDQRKYAKAQNDQGFHPQHA